MNSNDHTHCAEHMMLNPQCVGIEDVQNLSQFLTTLDFDGADLQNRSAYENQNST